MDYLPCTIAVPKRKGHKAAVLMLSGDWAVDLDSLAAGHIVLLVPPRPWSAGTEAAKSPLQGNFYLLSLRAQLVGKTILGMRVEDIIAAVDLLRARPDVEHSSITVYGKGVLGVVVLHAAALDRRITRVVVEGMPESYRDIVDEPLHRSAAEIVVPGVLRHYDIPDLIRAIAPRPVTVLNSLHPEPLLPHLMK